LSYSGSPIPEEGWISSSSKICCNLFNDFLSPDFFKMRIC